MSRTIPTVGGPGKALFMLMFLGLIALVVLHDRMNRPGTAPKDRNRLKWISFGIMALEFVALYTFYNFVAV